MLLVGNKKRHSPSSRSRSSGGCPMAHCMGSWRRTAPRVDVVLTSAPQSKQAIKELIGKIEHYRKGRDVYVLAWLMSVKSTLHQCYYSGNRDKEVNMTSRFPGTTLDKIEIPLADGKAISTTTRDYPLPPNGLIICQLKNLKYISPKKGN